VTLVENSSISTITSVSDQQSLTQAIKNAAAQTGSDFAGLLREAAIESGLDPNAKAKTSSATGLFQFTGQTWLHMIKARGAEYGLSTYADHIQVDSSGKAHVSDPGWRDAILNLRQDPQISAEMTCELDNENRQKLHETLGGRIGHTELYLAHFLGAGGASSFLNAMRANPNTKAADILPNAAGANASVFYGADGQSRSVAQIYQHFAQKFDQPPATITASGNYTGTASPLHPSHVNSEAASLFATMILRQMDDDAEGDSALSVLV
jgi:hypothetical protein